jgi:hypothetical protein
MVMGGIRDGGAKIHQGPGRLLGYIASNFSANTAQTVTFCDNTQAGGLVLHRIRLAVGSAPFCARFGETGRQEGISSATALNADPGECYLNVWSEGYEGFDGRWNQIHR